ncbi:amidohydrolase family protein [Salipiger sp. H15]|uniref:amidohydrolase family protein n=1 Tax=Alloyangia sp. H15 TaxID=3029062 RepID=UPI0033652C8E
MFDGVNEAVIEDANVPVDPIDSKQMTPKEMQAAVQAAADWNTYVGAHAYNSEAVRRAIDAGVKVIEHGQMIEEETMRYAVDRGIWFTPFEILVQVTSRAGELIALSGPRTPYPGKLGVIGEGAYADLLLVNGTPLEDLDLLADPEANFALIMKDGVIYKNALD